jgi:hypothetical protein
MKTTTYYVCEICGSAYPSKEKAEMCENYPTPKTRYKRGDFVTDKFNDLFKVKKMSCIFPDHIQKLHVINYYCTIVSKNRIKLNWAFYSSTKNKLRRASKKKIEKEMGPQKEK